MPRRKRNRKNKRKVYKQQVQQHQNEENVQKSNNKTVVQRTPMEARDAFYTLPDVITPLRTPSTSNSVSRSRNYSLIDTTTPINVRVASIRRSSSRTNLSKRFEDIFIDRNIESLNNLTPKCSRTLDNDSYINNLSYRASAIDLIKNRVNKCAKNRSNSSMSKLRSPGLDRIPVMIDVATQTVSFKNITESENATADDECSSDVYLQSCINIFETPKISRVENLERRVCSNRLSRLSQDNAEQGSPYKKNDLNESKMQNLKYVQQFNEIMFPSPKLVKNEIRNNESDCDIITFSPQLKTVSTPIDRYQKTDRILENMAKNLLTAHLDRKLQEKRNDYINFSPKTPNDKNFNSKFDDTCKINKLDSYISKRRMYNSVSPKKGISGRYSKNNSFKERSLKRDSSFIPKTFSPQRSSHSRSDNFLNMSNSNMYTRFISNVKKIHSRYSNKWFNIVKDVCSDLGITVKRVRR